MKEAISNLISMANFINEYKRRKEIGTCVVCVCSSTFISKCPCEQQKNEEESQGQMIRKKERKKELFFLSRYENNKRVRESEKKRKRKMYKHFLHNRLHTYE